MAGTFDVVVVGAGIIGCAVAYELARRGARVTMADDRPVGHGATRASGGMLVPYIEARPDDPLLRLGSASLALYDEFVARVAADAGMAVEYRRTGTLQVALDEGDIETLRAALDAQRTAGVASEWLDAEAARRLEPHLAPDVLAGLFVPAHGYVAAEALASALVAAASRFGARIEVGRVVRVERRDGRLVARTAGDGRLEADRIVLAAGSWTALVEVDGERPLPIRPVRGQLLHLAWPGEPMARIVWGPRCYLVPRLDGSLLVGATVEETGFDERATVAGVRDLIEAACEVVPEVWRAGFGGARAGLRPATPDHLPVIGPSRAVAGLVYATGHFRNGVLLAPLTAALVAGLLLDDREDELLAALSPERFS
ncbi:MAG TPA: glycine oxidase ThiO [Vicinamibacterales bacterium]|nr:glycine oxidase ThiO [Vicinamibacterales bacterium]